MRTSTLLMLSAAAALGGCAVGPDFKAPAPRAASGYTAQPLPAATASAPVPGGEAQRLAEANVRQTGGICSSRRRSMRWWTKRCVPAPP